MSLLTLVGESDASRATSEMYANERHRVGRLPNYALAFGARPAVYAAWRQLVGAVTSSMPTRRFELATLAAAVELRSTYCSVAHGAILADSFLAPEDVVELVHDRPVGALTKAERAVYTFAAKVVRSAAEVTADDMEHLRRHGLDESEILDVILAVSARCFFSTVLDATGTQADPQYAEKIDPAMLDALTVGRPVAGLGPVPGRR